MEKKRFKIWIWNKTVLSSTQHQRFAFIKADVLPTATDMENIPFWCVFVVFNVLASSEYFELKTECFPQWAHTLTMWKNKASFSQPSLSITILCILCMQGEAVRRTEAVCRGRALLWLVFNIKWFTFFLRAFEISSRASALVTDPELLGHGSNTQTAVTDLSHLCINQMSVEEKRTTVMGKICRLSKSVFLMLSPSFSLFMNSSNLS